MNVSKTRITKDILIYTFLPKISVFANLLITPLISPYLSLDDYGFYGLIIAYFSVFQIFINLGQNVVLQNAFFEYGNNYRLIWRRSFGIMMIAGLVSALIFTIIIYFSLSTKLGDNWILVCILVGINLVLSPIEYIAINYYVLHEKSLPYAICATIVGVVSVGVNYYTIKILQLGYLGWLIVFPISSLIMYVYYFRRLFKKERLYPSFFIKKSFLINALKVGGPLIPHQLSLYVLGTSDRLVLEYSNVSTRKIGLYSQGYGLASYANVLINGIFQALARKLQEGFRSEEMHHILFIKKTMISTVVLINSVLFLGSIWMKEIFEFLYRKPELQQAYPVAIIAMCSFMFWVNYTFFTYPLSIQKKTFSISKISISAAILNLIGNIVFIPTYGIWAALGTTYLSYIIFGVSGIFNKANREFFDKYLNIEIFCILTTIINILLFGVAYLSKDFNSLSKIFISSSLCVILFFLYKMTKEKLNLLPGSY